MAQAVTEVITDFGGFWQSSSTTVNPVKPNNSHNLLAFSFKGTRYATGVDNSTLSARGIPFVPMTFVSLPVKSIPGTITTTTKIGLGAMYDGVPVGASNPPPQNNIPFYLSDGINGLNLGTCVANLPVGIMVFPIHNLTAGSIGDGVPDILVTQVADPSGSSFDRYSFTDLSGNQVGSFLDIIFTNIQPVGGWLADFYEASTNPMTLAASFTNGPRDLRLWAADFADFGITAANIGNIKNFQIRLSGVSDVAFVAHNNFSFQSVEPLPIGVLPVSLTHFSGKLRGRQVLLTWQTASEQDNRHFAVETSTDGIGFSELARVPGAGNSSSKLSYTFTHATPGPGANYYRLRQVDHAGTSTLSHVIRVAPQTAATALSLYPNPAHKVVSVTHGPATGQESLRVYDMAGRMLLQQAVRPETGQTEVALQGLCRGFYQVAFTDGFGNTTVRKLMVEAE